MNRLAIMLVSLMGSAGLALAVAYVLLVVRAFTPGQSAATAFLIGESDATLGFGFLLFAVPYALLVGHLFARIRLGSWLLARGDDALALDYATRRMKPNLLRPKKEAIAHRIVVARVHVRRGDYDRAWEVLGGTDVPRRAGQWGAAAWRWKLEVALRREDLVAANAIVEQAQPLEGRGPDAADFHAAVAELRVRERDRAGAEAALKDAAWAHPRGTPRMRWSRAAFATEYATTPDELRDALQGLGEATAWLDDVRGAEGEVLLVEARLREALGDEAPSLPDAPPDRWDERSVWLLRRDRARNAGNLEEE